MKKMQFSVFGDSISTLYGYQPPEYAVEYKGRFARESCVLTIKDTWWGMVINQLEGTLLVNDSYSGCMVSSSNEGAMLYPSAASEKRINALCSSGVPDVLMIYLGTNDWGRNVVIEDNKKPWWATFLGAYDHMLDEIRKRMPNTEIWCLNLTYSESMRYYFYKGPLQRLGDYNKVIARVARQHNARLIDLASKAADYTSADLAHPDRVGMMKIANAVITSVK